MMTLQIPVTALLFVMMFHQPVLASTELPTLSCAETAGTELVPLNEPCNVNGEQMDFACTEILPANILTHTIIIKNFTVTEEVETENSRTYITFCIAMTSLEKKNLMSVFSGKFLTLNMTFASNLSVGILVVNRNCWSFKELNCHHRVFLRSDVMSLPPMVYTPNSPFFWDFSLPLLQAGAEWVETLSVTGEGLAVDPRDVSTILSQSSIFSLVETFKIYQIVSSD
ncbi:hypothetical protein R5R35_007610 [Gryllus longicercus]|uniref:Uncharacterized protein n=1 Tax=Gryllus longicercus TaxID=2509291 RepID=A0AAN9Z385_9ORTH